MSLFPKAQPDATAVKAAANSLNAAPQVEEQASNGVALSSHAVPKAD